MPVLLGGGGGRRFVSASGGPLAPGVRASPSTVGYLGSLGDLTVINSGNAPAGTNWDNVDSVLYVTGNNVTLDHYQINGTIICTGDNTTLTNCRIVGLPFYAIDTDGASATSVLTVSDTTIQGPGDIVGGNVPVSATTGGKHNFHRVKITGYGDGIHCSPESQIVQVSFTNPVLVLDIHVDGVQIFRNAVETDLLIRDCWVDVTDPATGLQTNGVNQSSSIGAGDYNTGAATVPHFINNYLRGGAAVMRLDGGTDAVINAVVTDNNFGPTDPSGDFTVSCDDPASVLTWERNYDYLGALIPQPT